MVALPVIMFALLVWGKLLTWLVFIGTLTIVMTLKLAPLDYLLSGFSNPGVITVTAAKLYMPMSFSSILGSTMTLIGTSTNLIIAGLIISAGLPALNIFAPTLVGVPAALIGIAFLITFGNRLLPEGVQGEDDFAKLRNKAEFLVFENSPLIGKTILESGLAEAPGYQLVEFEHADIGSNPQEQESRPAPFGLGLFHRLTRTWRARPKKGLRKPGIDKQGIDLSQVIQEYNTLTYITDNQALPGSWTTIGIKSAKGMPLESKRHTHQLVEVVVAPSHPAVGRYISELPVREDPPYSAEIVAISRDNLPSEVPLQDFRIQGGDVGV